MPKKVNAIYLNKKAIAYIPTNKAINQEYPSFIILRISIYNFFILTIKLCFSTEKSRCGYLSEKRTKHKR